MPPRPPPPPPAKAPRRPPANLAQQPGVWSVPDLDHILSGYGIFVVERSGSAVHDALAPLKEWSTDRGQDWVGNIHVIRQLIVNDISSTGIRQFLRQGMSVHYLLPACVIEYIREHGLYREEGKEKRASSNPPQKALAGKEAASGSRN